MNFSPEIKTFISEYVKHIRQKDAAIFAGAGLSRIKGFVTWAQLLDDIATELGLDISKESDFISIAQYHVNKNQNIDKIRRKIMEEFSDISSPSEVHQTLAKLPIETYWTTNYDTLIEDALKQLHRKPDVKHEVKQLPHTVPNRKAVVYKMHGDVHHPADAIITKDHFEKYSLTHQSFATALNGDLLSKTFLFIGFSFTDPNLANVLARLSFRFGESSRQHYCFIRRIKRSEFKNKADYEYANRKQELMVQDLKRYKIQALLIEEYEDILSILKEIERQFQKKTIFISGSAVEYGSMDTNQAQEFIHKLSSELIRENLTIVNGFGWGVGSAIINGALERIFENQDKYSEEQLILRPFPQFKTGTKLLTEMWDEYRHQMISMAGIALFLFGNKSKDGQTINADGVMKEFDVAISKGLLPIPVGATGYMSKEIWRKVDQNFDVYYKDTALIRNKAKFMELNDNLCLPEVLIKRVVDIIKLVNK
ncbi:SIR2 family protein [Xanthocytophaga agilis]|uniref:NAD(+) hydrolase ThsA n=1 Tax=Xanthocytophaga agilis TaxID=3048010 RepID=A0AAE3UG46_9BACT|nr:SIR2 family protein [Xanthocytophaga agilis]MDJ1502052.1 SIR2 family protein [Xanthocytophaga agilis]